MPFPDARRHIARAAQRLRDRHFLERKLPLDLRLDEFLRHRIGVGREENS